MIAIQRWPETRASNLTARVALVVGCLVLCGLCTFAALLVQQRGWPLLQLCGSCGDFRTFYQAALSAQTGNNVYQPTYVLYSFHYIPAFTVLLRPFTIFPIAQAYSLWAIFLLSAQAISAILLARQYGRAAFVALAALSPALYLALSVGQPLPLLVLGYAATTIALQKRRWGMAGIFLAIAWLKPQIGLPAAFALLALYPRVAYGFIPISAALLAISPRLFFHWLHMVTSLTTAQEPNQISLPGVVPTLLGPHHPGYIVLMVLTLGVSVIVARREADPARCLALLMLIWFMAAPVSHAYDTTLLIVPATVLLPSIGVLLLDCWLCTALSFYSLSVATFVAPLLLVGVLATPRDERPISVDR